MPVAILLCSIPAITQHRGYFEAETFGGTVGALALILVVTYAAILLGALVWFFIVLPVVLMARIVVDLARGRHPSWKRYVIPPGILALGAFVMVAALAIDDLRPGRMATGQIISALLGIPGTYTVVWEEGLWIARLLLVVVIAIGVPLGMKARRTSDR
ncbi:hypothetical protein [Microbacterium sulfonylureivorans]|uniref:hypothetical protein n=1 Tax=Microbacterium sulfonylureivorans TaxID=2486854 RepID=UPI000FDB54BF|nr:hypothetical protein [Microbacterium sulfonylureivorans]